MKTISITELRKHFEYYGQLAEDGETITITKWGRPVMDLRPHGKIKNESEVTGK